MAKQNIKTKEGFTIIEVVLVLAIAGLIFLMVFVALPALQRSQRDTQRRDDMARFMSQLSQYQANNRNNIPANTTAAWNSFISNYLKSGGDTFQDPDGTDYKVGYVCVLSNASTCSSTSTDGATAVLPNSTNMSWATGYQNYIYVYTGARCDGENITYVPNSPKQVAIRYKLEGAGIYCNSN